jgi:hypothetical protein
MIEVFGTEFRKAYYLFIKMQLSGAACVSVRPRTAGDGGVDTLPAKEY